jgi:translin
MSTDLLDDIAATVRNTFEEVNTSRDLAYQRSRKLTSICAHSIRATHREDWEKADQLLAEAKTAVQTLVEGVSAYPALYYAGYTQDAIKEYVEAQLTYALVRNLPLPPPGELGAEPDTWLNGLAEGAMELRRRILDILRHGHSLEVERLLQRMDDIYTVLVTFDYTDAVTGGLRRRTDTLRGVLERTRGDVTTSLRQSELEQALEALERRLGAGAGE